MTEFSVDADRRRGHSGEDRTAFFAGDERAGGGDLLLSGGIAGAQASIFQRASVTASETLPLLDKIDVLSWESNNRDISRLKNLIRSGFAEVVGELSMPGGPRVARVEQIFALLLDQLAALHDGIEDEENLARFRIVTDNTASLYRSWNNIQQLFGTQTGIVTQQFGLVADAVEEVRQTMDAVFLGAEERLGMVILAGSADGSSLSVEDLLTWIHDFVSGEGPQALDDAGGFALRNTIFPLARKLRALVLAGLEERNLTNFPKRCSTPPLHRAMKNLEGRLDELAWNC